MAIECKLFVKLYLSKNGKWGGAETMQAVSELEQVNIVVFNEDGPCYVLNSGTYDRSVCVAYRLAISPDAKIIRDHYDSVCEQNSTVLYETSQAIENRKN